MQRFAVDSYVVDVLMADLVGHDRRPAAYLVYLYLLRRAQLARRDVLEISLQQIASGTGLSKSSVQAGLRHLKRRGLVDSSLAASSARPVRRLLRPWSRPRVAYATEPRGPSLVRGS